MTSTGFNEQLAHGATLISQWALEPLRYIGQPEKRLYWVFILSSLLLALFALYLQHGKKLTVRRIYRTLFSRAYWLNKSTATDVFYLLLNSLVRGLVLVPLLGSKLLATILVARFFQSQFDTPPDFNIAPAVIILLYTLCFFILEDISRFALHLAMHKLPWLWYFHKVHHSATILTPLTLHRIHPMEMTLYFLRGTAVFGLVSGLFIYLFGKNVGSLEILGVGAIGFLFNLMGANLRHSHIWLGFGPLEKLFISPAQHQLHHSSDPSHRDINFGTSLALWDRLLGSWRTSGKRPAKLRFGIANTANSAVRQQQLFAQKENIIAE